MTPTPINPDETPQIEVLIYDGEQLVQRELFGTLDAAEDYPHQGRRGDTTWPAR